MSEVILHLGLHKTATGVLQRQFFPECKDLQLFTTLVPEMKDFVHMVTRKDPIYFEPDQARELVSPLLSKDKPNVLSNESLSGPPYAGVIESGLDHRSPILGNLRKVFPEAKAVLVLRRQDNLARSFYRQYLKSGGTRSVRRFYGMDESGRLPLMCLDRFSFSRYIDLVMESFPSGVLLLAYEEFSKDQTEFLKKLTEFIGVERPDIDLRRENSTTLGPTGMEFSRIFNHLFRSQLNPGGLIPGIPMMKYGKRRNISPLTILHDHWPGKSDRTSQSEIGQIAQSIFQEVQKDNEIVDEKYNLGLKKYQYY